MPKIRTLAMAALLLGAASSAAVAQSPASRAPTSNQPVMIGADGGEMTNSGFALRGRAEVTQGDNRLRAEAIEGVSANGSVSRITASGGVYYVTPNETIRGDRAIYTASDATIVITGDVILTQGQNVLTGSRLTYNVDSGAARMEGSPRGSAGNRVQGVFYPQGN